MIRIVFSLVMFFHGLIHILGFVKGWNLAELEFMGELPAGIMAKITGILWLIACMIFIIAAATYLLRAGWWWMIAAAGIAISQVLIFIYWRDAGLGTIANIIILSAVVLSYGAWNFDRMVEDDINSLLPGKKAEKVVTETMIADLPQSVQKWLRRSNIIGKDMIRVAHLKQKGEMRIKPDGEWMRVDAEQYVTTDPPGFVWIADVKSSSLFMYFSGRDKYEDGRGHMLIKLFSLIPVADAKGEEIDQGALLRYLGEMVWYPSAALSDYLTWEEIDSTTARATMSYGGLTASGVFKFNKDGEFMSFEADRYFYRGEGSTMERWVINAEDYGEFEGISIPVNLSVTWKFERDFTWYRLEITEMRYNEGL